MGGVEIERVNSLQLPNVEIEPVDHETPSRLIKPSPGFFFAVEPGSASKIGSLYVPDDAARSLQSDCVVVIAAGEGVCLEPGDRVLVRPDHGLWLEGFAIPGYTAERRIRVYGMAWDENQIPPVPVRIAWDRSAVIKLENGQMNALGHNIIISRDAIVQSERGIHLPDMEHHRTCLATVVSVGGNVTCGVSPGDRISYNPIGILDFLFTEDPNLAVLREEGLNAIILADDAA